MGAMAGTRRSKRLLDEPPGEDLPAKRLRKPPQNSLAAFDAKHLPANIPKRSTGSRKAIPPPIARTLASLAIQRVQKEPISISSSLAASTPGTLHPTPTKKRPKPLTPQPPAFDPTSALDKPPHYVSIFVVPIMDGSRKEQDTIPLSVELNNVRRATLEDLQNEFYQEYVKDWDDRRGLIGGNKARKLHWKVTIGNPKGNHRTIRVRDESL
jgi:hypothetical protein